MWGASSLRPPCVSLVLSPGPFPSASDASPPSNPLLVAGIQIRSAPPMREERQQVQEDAHCTLKVNILLLLFFASASGKSLSQLSAFKGN